MTNFLKGYLILIILSALVSINLSSCSKDKEKPESTSETTEEEKSDDKETNGDDEKISEEFKIEMDLSGPVSGTMDIYRKGDKYRSDLKTKVMDQSMNTTTFSDGEYVYVILDAMGMKKAVKINKDKYDKEMNIDKKEVDVMNVAEQLSLYEKIGTETIIGKECDIYKVSEGVTFSIYDDKYILKMGKPEMNMTAVNLDIDASLSDDLFEPTEGVEFKEVESLVKGLGK